MVGSVNYQRERLHAFTKARYIAFPIEKCELDYGGGLICESNGSYVRSEEVDDDLLESERHSVPWRVDSAAPVVP
jgi:hypothetical protein